MGNQASNDGSTTHVPRAMTLGGGSGISGQRPFGDSANMRQSDASEEHEQQQQQQGSSLPTEFGKHPLTGRGFYPIPRSQLATHDVDQDSAPQPRQSSTEKAFSEEHAHIRQNDWEKEHLPPQGLSPLQGLRSMFSNVSPKLAPRRMSVPTVSVTKDAMKERGDVMVIDHIQGGINADNAETGYDQLPRVQYEDSDVDTEERDPTRIVMYD